MSWGAFDWPILKHCVVTGGAGFIGSHLVETLLARGDRVSVIDDESTGSLENLAAVEDHPNLRYFKGSVGRPQPAASAWWPTRTRSSIWRRQWEWR